MAYEITTQVQLRKLFWKNHIFLSKKKIKNHAGNGLMYTTDARCAFADYVDCLMREGVISEALANRAIL